MATLDDLAAVIGGTVRSAPEHSLDTKIGGFRAVIISRRRPLSESTAFDLAVWTPVARELDPFHLAGKSRSLGEVPHLPHGFVFTGLCGGVLTATSTSPPTVQHVVETLWVLAHIAREPLKPTGSMRDLAGAQERRNERRRRRLGYAIAIGVGVIAALLRRSR